MHGVEAVESAGDVAASQSVFQELPRRHAVGVGIDDEPLAARFHRCAAVAQVLDQPDEDFAGQRIHFCTRTVRREQRAQFIGAIVGRIETFGGDIGNIGEQGLDLLQRPFAFERGHFLHDFTALHADVAECFLDALRISGRVLRCRLRAFGRQQAFRSAVLRLCSAGKKKRAARASQKKSTKCHSAHHLAIAVTRCIRRVSSKCLHAYPRHLLALC